MLASKKTKSICLVCNGTGLLNKSKKNMSRHNPASLCPNCTGLDSVVSNPVVAKRSAGISPNVVVGLSLLGALSLGGLAIYLTKKKESEESLPEEKSPAEGGSAGREQTQVPSKPSFEMGKSYAFGKFKVGMIACPAGEFNMGYTGFSRNPPRVEKIDKPFLLAKTEVTQDLYEKVMGSNPSNEKDDKQNPVDTVSWEDAVKFCNKLSQLDGLDLCYSKKSGADLGWSCNFNKNGYRLPTIKEWEYAAKAGTENRWAGTDDESKLAEYAWYAENSDAKVHPVGELKPNEWGFHDMTGNLSEWCWDTYTDGGVLKKCCMGGMYLDDAHSCKTSNIGVDTPTADLSKTFRLCKTIL